LGIANLAIVRFFGCFSFFATLFFALLQPAVNKKTCKSLTPAGWFQKKDDSIAMNENSEQINRKKIANYSIAN